MDESANALCGTLTAAGRWDLYGPIHKGLRYGHMMMLQRIGTTDFAGDFLPLLTDLKQHLKLVSLHLQDEEVVIHPALESRQTHGASEVEQQHRDHRRHLSSLNDLIGKIEEAEQPDTLALGRRLYLSYSRFVAEDMLHLAHEEEVVWPSLCAIFSDDELRALEMQIVGRLAPEDMMAFMKIMIPALNRSELALLIGGLKHGAPSGVHAAVIEQVARPALASDDIAYLEQLGLA